jgi:Raf kinase inhibitor-like YbhB/YbcL family protein
MNLQIHDFINSVNNKIKKKYICKKQDGYSYSPRITWNNIDKTKSYALILEDPDAPGGPFIHWYVPYINNNILEINELNHNYNLKNSDKISFNSLSSNIIQGKNRLGNIGYYGPCAPNQDKHNYFFIIYALDGKIDIDNNLSIDNHIHFEEIIKNSKINILAKDSKSFQYSYKNYNE